MVIMPSSALVATADVAMINTSLINDVLVGELRYFKNMPCALP